MVKKKILIYGLYDWCNLGDDLMMYEINNKIKKQNITPYFIRNDDDNYFEFERNYDKNLFLNKKNNISYFNKIFKYYELIKLLISKSKYDALIFMGGGYINRSIGSGYGQLIYIYLLKTIFKIKNKKVYFTGQTVGPINTKIERFIIRKIYKNANVAVRETESEKVLNSLRINNILVGDDAFLGNNNIIEKKVKEKFIIVNYKDFRGYESIKKDFEKFLIDLSEKTSLKIILIPFRKGFKYDEYKIHKQFFEKLKNIGVNVEMFETNSVEELNQLFASCEFVISTSYHGVVLSLKNNKKVYTGFIGKYYQIKMGGITGFYSKDSFQLYDLSKRNIFEKILNEINNNEINVKNISLKLNNNVNQHWDKILKEIEYEK